MNIYQDLIGVEFKLMVFFFIKNDGSDIVTCTLKDLCYYLATTETTIVKCLKGLEEKGYIEIINNNGVGVKRTANSYRLKVPFRILQYIMELE